MSSVAWRRLVNRLFVRLLARRVRRRAAERRRPKRNRTAYMIRYQRERCARDPAYRTLLRLRCRLRSAVKAQGSRKSASTMSLVGCSPAELRAHLESKFTGGMSWSNQGKWHVDHIRPCASFDLTDPDQQKACFHYTNLQPLWGIDNLCKGSKVYTGKQL
tara:strand:+ start:543 stop:1022 length:480 start_codon:yes stop_codon:yes gene_type:complete